jgi:L-rhamnose isomerase
MDFKNGDRVRRIVGEHNGFRAGDTGTIINIYTREIDVDGKGSVVGNDMNNLELISYKDPLTDLKGGSKKVEKKIINVLVVDKKTGKEVKNENVVAVDTTSALLKAYKIDSESLFIKTTEVGSYQEEPKPVEVVMSNKK